MGIHRTHSGLRSLALIIPGCLIFLSPWTEAAEPVDYVRDIKPILSGRCYFCHGALRQKSGLRLDTAALVRKGGKSGPAVISGQSGASVLIDAVTGNKGMRRMPPQEEGEPLSSRDIALLKAWIDQGARGPEEAVPPDPRLHWAFRPPLRPPLPAVANSPWLRNPIDAFFAAEHDRHRLQASKPASRPVLMRRVYLDLIGLPPTREELHAFLADSSENAYETVVERLLASPQYAERWARHWMDVWRYSDWYGRRAVPDVWNSAPQIWRWRDWIIRSLNRDQGYDQMVREMLAADEIAPADDEAVVATGFIVRNWYALNYNQWKRDLVEHTGKAFLGLTLNCAHCHDHKYDPITQEDYFRFRAFFEPLELRQDRLPGEPDPGPFQKYDYSVLRKVVHAGAIRVFDEKPDAKTYLYLGGDERNRAEGRPPVTAAAPDFLGGRRLPIESIELSPTAYYPGLKPFIQREETERRRQAVALAQTALDRARQSLASGQRQLDEINTQAQGLRLIPPVIADARARALGVVGAGVQATRLTEAQLAAAEADLQAVQARVAADNARYHQVHRNAETLAKAAAQAERRGAWCTARTKQILAEQGLAAARTSATAAPDGKAKEVTAAAVRAAEQQLASAVKTTEAALKSVTADSSQYSPLSPVYPSTSTGRRRALAQWITGRDNPLTARVAVNHIWMRHFQQALVESVFDFGRNGKRPSHPELLDWLAVEFMEAGWSQKHLHRLIVTSNTYRMQSTSGSNQVGNRLDEDNHWLWRYPTRRMEAEVVRDSVLAASGELEAAIGGPVLENIRESSSRRRSLYFSVYPEDGGHAQFLELFDAPDPCDCYRRTESIVPQQALVMTNSRFLLRQSRLLARKLWAQVSQGGTNETAREAAFIEAAFAQILSRMPSQQEQAVCREFLIRQADLFRQGKVEANGSDDPVKPAVEPHMRARESLVRALFSHDDFVTIR
jgi:hypothetical protein